MDRLNLDKLHEITDKHGEKLLYALLSEEKAIINARPYDEGLVELLLEFPEEMEKLPKMFLSDKLKTLGWDISERS